MRDILEPITKWWDLRRDVRPGHGGAHVQQRAPRAGRRDGRVGRRRGRRQRVRRLRRGRRLRAGRRGHRQRPAGAAALRDQRRRRLRGRPDLRRHHRHLRRAGQPGAVRRTGRDRRGRRSGRAGRRRHGHRGPGRDRRPADHLGRRAAARRARSAPATGWTRPWTTTRGACSRRASPGSAGTARTASGGWTTWRVFVQSFAPPPRMLVFGAIDFAAAVARAGKFLGYRVTVCDARPVFATAARFPDADEVVDRVAAPVPVRHQHVDERTVICVLTHDPKFDVPAARGRAAQPAALHRRDGQPAHRTTTGWPGSGRRG